MKQLPQNIFVFLILVVALFIIMIVQRPHSICESQTEIFKANQIPYLYLDTKKTFSKTRNFDRDLEFCKSSNSTGGCLEFFEGMKRLYYELDRAPSGCTAQLASLPEVKQAVFSGLELMVRVAWGSAPPAAPMDRAGWLDSSQVAVFCDYKKIVQSNYGEDSWNAFAENMMTALPGAEKLGRNDLWVRTLLSDPCR